MTAAQRLCEEGRQEGRLEAREEALQRGRLLLLRMVQQRFGDPLDPLAEQRLRTATFEQVEAWLLRAFTAASLAELLADSLRRAHGSMEGERGERPAPSPATSGPPPALRRPYSGASST